MEWARGDTIGFGSFGIVSLVLPRKGFPKSPLMAVKSCETSCSGSLKNEKKVLDQLSHCPQIIRCFGDDNTHENGVDFYNLFLEYANRGSLADHVKRNGGNLMESDVRRYVRSILKGLSFVHSKGFAHCDIKLQNILLFGNGDVKIADFGLAKKNGEEEENQSQRKTEIRGTPLNLAPESVNRNDYDSQVDIWALGCTIVEMLTGKPAWNLNQETTNVAALLIQIGVSDELPGIPESLSQEGKDFLGNCFVKDPKKRWTAKMLLDHPFIVGTEEEEEKEESISPNCDFEELSDSPKCHFDFPDWVSTQSTYSFSQSNFQENSWSKNLFSDHISSPLDRIRQLACDKAPNWLASESWFTARR